jgi:hypothetical protein
VRLKERAEVAITTAFFAGFVMLIAGIVSLTVFLEFIYDGEGEISVSLGSAGCVVVGIAMLIVVMVFNLTLALLILRSARTDRARRAAYFQILFPILLASFILSTPMASFTPSIAFGFPLLLMGAFLYPYSAVVMRREVLAMEKKNVLHVRCASCTYLFEMHKDEDRVRCPYCGQANSNPMKAEEALEVDGVVMDVPRGS